ncbi:hypothetical protein M408DRAFT_332832 [Serendipita vermifera MAFF 305830]|uniref:Thioester reductase (TE) domain-containing protein n=1 Tax=Serendipita vermifera MAFF 305830 TaxID=933852 RepID=A0A0C2WZE6_SERVB|nr:hypothetical protein M408DRAFT_332832 [Serendipita vermifera MAFF 305830]
MTTQTKPNVLIFGTLNLLAGPLMEHLIPPSPAEPLVGHIRIIDKYSINPPTTFVSKSIRSALENHKDLVEYRQENVTNPDVVTACFNDPSPNGHPYSHVFDLTGDLNYEHPVAAHIAHTLAPAVIIARCSAAQLARSPGSIKAHIRMIPPFYEQIDDNTRYKEDDEKGWRFDVDKGAIRALVWHETIRAVGAIEGLPLVMLKFGIPYGDNMVGFEITSLILLGLVYQRTGKEMKILWSPNLPKNTINTRDFVGLMWAAAEWTSTRSRDEANAVAGVPIHPSNDPSLMTSPPPSQYLIPASVGAVVVPIFNAVDESDSTQQSLAAVISEVFGVKVGFYTGLPGLLAGWGMRDVTEDVNETHMEEWSKIIANSFPPVPQTPLSPYMSVYQLEEHGCALDSEKTRKILQYKFKYPHFSKDSVQGFIEWCKKEEIWPLMNASASK